MRIEVGERVMLTSGYAMVVGVHRDGCEVRSAVGEAVQIAWPDLQPGTRGDAEGKIHVTLRPLFDSLSPEAMSEALMWLEVVQEILTGYRSGHAALAEDGEPFAPYGPTYGVSVDKRCARMAEQLSHERSSDRNRRRRVRAGELKTFTVNRVTVRNKVNAWLNHGFPGLVDGRRMRRTTTFDTIDETFKGVIADVVGTLDGDRSTLNHREIIRSARVQMKKNGVEQYHAPQRAVGEYVSWLMKGRGSTTRAQRSTKVRGTSGTTSFEAVRPGQVVAIDATRADVLVWDATHERPFSVEILTAIDVATRVVLALRVVPKSADGLDAGLLLYDVMRPFSQVVSGTSVSHWRWAGQPSAVDLTGVCVATESGLLPTGVLEGEHQIPSVLPGAIRADHGSIFVGMHFRLLLRDFGIDLLLSRGTRPTDNSYIERLHETFQRAYQALPGFKGRNVAGRGRKTESEPLCTAAELEEHLRRWVALDYHQSWHQGLILPDAPQARLTPIEMFDAMLAATGRIDVPQSSSLLYQFLPIRWGTIRHAGVEFRNLVYDARCLDDFRNPRIGQFRAQDGAAPFYVDDHDLSRIWFADPDTGLVHEVAWRAAYKFDAPMTDKILQRALTSVRRRGGNLSLNVESTQRRILDHLTELTTAPEDRESRAVVSAAARRVETSRRDHTESQDAQTARVMSQAKNVTRISPTPPPTPPASEVSVYDDQWPDLEDGAP